MSIYSNAMPVSLVPFEVLNAPFAKYDEEATLRLKRMGVIDEEEVPFEVTLAILAATFANHFYESYTQNYPDILDNENNIISELSDLWVMEDLNGLYYYLVLNCGLIDYPVPKEVLLIAAREDILHEYMENFIKVIVKLENEKNEKNEKNLKSSAVTKGKVVDLK